MLTRFAFPPREGGEPGPGRLTPEISQSLAVLTALRSITRVIGSQPIFHGGQSEDDAVLWARCLLEAGPALTHIGIIALDMSITGSAAHSVTKAIARVLLSNRRVRSLCFRYVCSQAAQEKDELIDFVQCVADPRLRIIVDERLWQRYSDGELRLLIGSSYNVRQIEIDDVKKSRDFWDPLPMDKVSVYHVA